MKKSLFFILLMAILGCYKDNFLRDAFTSQQGQLPLEIQVLEMPLQPTDGYATISSYATLSTQGYTGGTVIQGFCYDKQNKKRDFGALAFGPLVMSPPNEADPDYFSVGAPEGESLFGLTNQVSLVGKDELPGFTTNFYVPKIMLIISPSFSNNSVIAAGTTITWVPDPKNVHGVGISIKYSPTDIENVWLQLGGKSVSRSIRVGDIGSYTIREKDLADIPSQGSLRLQIGRGNYKIVPMADNYRFGLLAYTTVAHSFNKQ